MELPERLRHSSFTKPDRLFHNTIVIRSHITLFCPFLVFPVTKEMILTGELLKTCLSALLDRLSVPLVPQFPDKEMLAEPQEEDVCT